MNIKQERISSFSQRPSCLIRIMSFSFNTVTRIWRALPCFPLALPLADCLHCGKQLCSGQGGLVLILGQRHNPQPMDLGGAASFKGSKTRRGIYLLCLIPFLVLFAGSFSPPCTAILKIPALKRVRCPVGVYKVFSWGIPNVAGNI